MNGATVWRRFDSDPRLQFPAGVGACFGLSRAVREAASGMVAVSCASGARAASLPLGDCENIPAAVAIIRMPEDAAGRILQKQLADLEIVSINSTLNFDWDPGKSVSNEAKHGLSLVSASALWAGPVVVLPSMHPGEQRHLAIGLIEGRHWTVVYAPRGDRLRLISARRSRKNEKTLFKQLLG